MDEDLYETDFYTWTRRQAEHLRAGRLDRADLANIAEEIESSGRSQAAALRSAYRLIALHLLKMMVQPARATKSWRGTITRERLNAEECFADGPGLKRRRADLFAQAYGAARREAAAEPARHRSASPSTRPSRSTRSRTSGPPRRL